MLLRVGDRYEPLRQYLIDEMDWRNWNLAALARASGLSHATLSCVLNYVRRPSISFFEKIARGLGVPILDLLALAGYIPPEPPGVQEDRRLLRSFRGLGNLERGIVVAMAEGLAARAPDALETQVQDLVQGLGTDDVAQILALIESIK